MKETKREAKKEAAAPKWGTMEWLAAYPWSQTVVRSQARVGKAIGEDAWKEVAEGPHACGPLAKPDKVVDGNDVALAKKDMLAFRRALLKTQGVIAKLHEEAPLLDKYAKDADFHFERAAGLTRDLEHVTSDDGRKLLRNGLAKAMAEFCGAYRQLRRSVESVCNVNSEYGEKLGPRTRKPMDAERQQTLHGMEEAK